MSNEKDPIIWQRAWTETRCGMRVVRLRGVEAGNSAFIVERADLDSQRVPQWVETEDEGDRGEAVEEALLAAHDDWVGFGKPAIEAIDELAIFMMWSHGAEPSKVAAEAIKRITVSTDEAHRFAKELEELTPARRRTRRQASVDDAALRPLDVVVGVLEQLHDDVLDVLAARELLPFGAFGGVPPELQAVAEAARSRHEAKIAMMVNAPAAASADEIVVPLGKGEAMPAHRAGGFGSIEAATRELAHALGLEKVGMTWDQLIGAVGKVREEANAKSLPPDMAAILRNREDQLSRALGEHIPGAKLSTWDQLIAKVADLAVTDCAPASQAEQMLWQLAEALGIPGPKPTTWVEMLSMVRERASTEPASPMVLAQTISDVRQALGATPGESTVQAAQRVMDNQKGDAGGPAFVRCSYSLEGLPPTRCVLLDGHAGEHRFLAVHAPTGRTTGQVERSIKLEIAIDPSSNTSPEDLRRIFVDAFDQVQTNLHASDRAQTNQRAPKVPGFYTPIPGVEMAALRAELTALGKHVEDVERRAYAAAPLDGTRKDIAALDRLIRALERPLGDLRTDVDACAGKAETLEAVRSLTDALQALDAKVETLNEEGAVTGELAEALVGIGARVDLVESKLADALNKLADALDDGTVAAAARVEFRKRFTDLEEATAELEETQRLALNVLLRADKDLATLRVPCDADPDSSDGAEKGVGK